MKFTKMHGAGNDYIYIDCLRETVLDPASLARTLSQRRVSVGADGLVLICPGDSADFRMRMFNVDGSEAGMCGNAIRCVGKYVYDRNLTDKKDLTVETPAGVKRLELHVRDGKVATVRVDMGEPGLERTDVPMLGRPGRAIGEPLVVEGTEMAVTCLSMGNPHCVAFVEDVEHFPVERFGAAIEKMACFPERTNVEFAEPLSPTRVHVRVWERGCGETLACGTGACAVCVAGVLTGRTKRRVEVLLPGGALSIGWAADDCPVLMTGPAVEVYEGSLSS